jgi:hypothetical protein
VVILIVGFEYSTEEVHGLVERIERHSRLEIGPQRIEHLVAGCRESLPRHEKAQQG